MVKLELVPGFDSWFVICLHHPRMSWGAHCITLGMYSTICLPLFLSFVSAPYTRVRSFGCSHLSTVRKPAEVSLDML